MTSTKTLLAAAVALTAFAAVPATAAIIGVTGPNSFSGASENAGAAPEQITPASGFNVGDDDATNDRMQGFNEVQSFVLSRAIEVNNDGIFSNTGIIGAGTRVSSHFIFLNNSGAGNLNHGLNGAPVVWEFDGAILGVMSDSGGRLENESTDILGADGVIYPGGGTGTLFNARGFETSAPFADVANDFYAVGLGPNVLEIGMNVTEPGDWVRVVTAATPVPLPAAGWMLIAGLGGLGALSRKRRAA